MLSRLGSPYRIPTGGNDGSLLVRKSSMVGGIDWLSILANKKLFGNAAGDAPEFATGMKIGQIIRDTSAADGPVAETGVGFKPSHVIFLVGIDATSEVSIGVDGGASHKSISNKNVIAAGAWGVDFNWSIGLYQTAAYGIYCTGKITALDADGFTITWAKTGAKTGTAYIFYMAFR